MKKHGLPELNGLHARRFDTEACRCQHVQWQVFAERDDVQPVEYVGWRPQIVHSVRKIDQCSIDGRDDHGRASI